MVRLGSYRLRRWIVVLAALAMLSPACGSKRKRYLGQIMPLIEMNDAVDAKVAKLPKINAYKDPNYLQKLDSYIAQKQVLLSEMEAVEPPFLMSSTHPKLLQAMQNGIRYLQSEREKFMIAARKMQQTPPSQHRYDELGIIKEYQSQTSAYQANMREQLMKQQYERLYYDVKDALERAQKF